LYLLEEHIKYFSTLLKKATSIGANGYSGSEDEVEKLMQEIEDNYRRIKRCLVSDLDDLQTIADIFNLQQNFIETNVQNSEFWRVTLNKAVEEEGRFLFFEIKEKMAPFYRKKGDWQLAHDKIDKALDSWEEVLKIDPNNEYIQKKLDEIVEDFKAEHHKSMKDFS
jgi:hypothetical protein